MYYGHSKETYDNVKDQLTFTQLKQTGIMTMLFLIVMLITATLSVIGPIAKAHRYFYFNFGIIALVFEIVLFLAKKFVAKHPAIFMYMSMILMMAFSILSSRMDPFQIAVAFPAFVLVVSVVFIDNMLRYTIAAVASLVCFFIVSYYSKPPSIAQNDLMYGCIFTIIALIFHFRFQRNRIEQFANLHKIREIQRDLLTQSSFDNLSGLLMRGRFFSLASMILRERSDDDFVALCILDLDSFKQINDRYGHQMGDKALQTAAELIWKELDIDLSEKWSFCERAAAEKMSFAGRLGGDEFVIFFRNDDGMDAVKSSLRRILDSLNAARLGELSGICASFGVTAIKSEDHDIDTVYARADEALYEAKTTGKNRIVEG